QTADWKAASWETDTSVTPNRYYARVLVGGQGTGATIELAPGVYTAWVRITGNPEKPVLRAPNALEVV
ncbi:MAG TPA: hypothetical protein VNO79_00850, partial [Actinomycetota bacterium]|nr:hypothetical protein [Actinomycetota bacterium]